MGPKLEKKKIPDKPDPEGKSLKSVTTEDEINTDAWKCVVVMAVEKIFYDSFLLKEFAKEFSSGRRREIGLISYDFVVNLLNDFAKGELPYKYMFLLNFSSVLQEASDYLTRQTEIPVALLVKVIKVILYCFKKEYLTKTERKMEEVRDPVVAMAERPTNFGTFDKKKEPLPKEGSDSKLKVRPPSITKEKTTLLKRGHEVKDEERIDDAPLNGYFNFYVLLTGFYSPELPLELIKAGVPFHCLLCIDTSLSGMKRNSSSAHSRNRKQSNEIKSDEIQNFWEVFLKTLWDPAISPYFKDTIFQVYLPQRLLCEKKKLREFVYKEITYLMYDLSDFKRQLNNYLKHMNVWNVEEKHFEMTQVSVGTRNLSNECMTSAMVLQCLIDALSTKASDSSPSLFSGSEHWEEKPAFSDEFLLLSLLKKSGTKETVKDWSRELNERGDANLLEVYTKAKTLDIIYGLDTKSEYSSDSEQEISKKGSSQENCFYTPQFCGENMEEALSKDGVFRSYLKKYDKIPEIAINFDMCLYAKFMTKVLCPYHVKVNKSAVDSHQSLKRTSTFELIDNLSKEVCKPHFTVTEGSRSIIKDIPFNMKNISRDFFCPEELKVLSPGVLKASSAPQFRITPPLKIQTKFTSEIFSQEISGNPYENLKDFLNESFLESSKDFDFLELLNKPKFLEKQSEQWVNYNCIDHAYCLLNDAFFLVLHNRMDDQNVYHETFNEMLRTKVGLRDFYEYILEDESDWLVDQEESYQTLKNFGIKSTHNDNFKDFSNFNFWLFNSIKYQNYGGDRKNNSKTEHNNTEGRQATEHRVSERFTKKDWYNISKKMLKSSDSFQFDGYDVTDRAVQFSGLKTVYYAEDCSMTVELVERLYEDQKLGVHISSAGHTLHLYSLACPKPHLLDPFIFHLTCRNGMVVAFCRRFIETAEEMEEILDSKTTINEEKTSLGLSTSIARQKIYRKFQDEEFMYDMAASLPNGLTVRIFRRIVEPCYVRQQHLADEERKSRLENSRLFLPNGNVVKMMRDFTFEILNMNTSIVKGSLSDLADKDGSGTLRLPTFELITGEGHVRMVEEGKLVSSHRYQILRNGDVNTNQIFFRRRDGTNYVFQNDGTLCTLFKDETKISCTPFFVETHSKPTSGSFTSFSEEEVFEGENQETNEDDFDFVFVHVNITFEHPDYATLLYNTSTQKWTVMLPHDSTIAVDPDGQYFVNIDKSTELKVEKELIQMNKYLVNEQKLQCTASADLSVFEDPEATVYCHMEDLTGKIFVVEGNANCYLINDGQNSEDLTRESETSMRQRSSESELSEFVASEDLQASPSDQMEKTALSRSNKYFVLRRDMTGFEILHSEDFKRELGMKEKGSLVFIDHVPGTDNRIFVLITPKKEEKKRKWEVATILPNPTYVAGASVARTSSTYGVPPSWMHPFSKRKCKFLVPDVFSCRVFLETRKTEVAPSVGAIDCSYCENDELNNFENLPLTPEKYEPFLKRLLSEDQVILKEMYIFLTSKLINQKKNLNVNHSEKLQHYLEQSKYYVDKQEYHKRCIRYHVVPNYFHHPAGMSWLLLTDLLRKINFWEKKPVTQARRTKIMSIHEPLPPSSSSMSSFSNEELEYNLSEGEQQYFSDLSWRSDFSAQTAPAIMKTGNLCRCKVRPVRNSASAPIVDFCEESAHSEETFPRICDFKETDLKELERKENVELPMTLEDLMCLGLV